MNLFTLSHESETCSRSPEISSIAFHAQPSDLPPVSLMSKGFVVIGRFARHRRPHIRFLFIGSRVCSTLPSDPASRRRPCASLSLHPHQVVKRTFTSKLSNMLGVQAKGRAKALHYKICFSTWLLLDYEKGADGQDVCAGTVEATDGGTRVGDQRLAKKIE